MNIFDMLQLIGGIILSVGYFPQIIQTLKFRSVEDLNLNTYLSVAAGVFLMEIYAFHLFFVAHAGFMFLITNTLSLLMAATMAVLILLYKRPTYPYDPYG